MKKIVTIGAAGHLGREITRQLEAQRGIEQSCFDISPIPYTLIRTADLTEDSNVKYHLYKEEEKIKKKYVSSGAVAKLIVDIITSEQPIGVNDSIGITN